jgi:Spy/CpxP family protein refolding chaperone
MISYRTLISSLLLASSLGFVAAPVVAKSDDCGPGHMTGEFMEHRAEYMEKHHKELHAALKLTPDQEGAWTKLTGSEQSMAKTYPGNFEEWAKLTTPERADKMLESSRERLAQQTEHVAALKGLYAVLTPAQKKVFDDFHSAMRDDMHRESGHRASRSAMPTITP